MTFPPHFPLTPFTFSTMGHAESGGIDQLLFPFFAVFIGLVLDEVNKRVNFLGIPDSVMQFGFALIAAIFMNLCIPSETINEIDAQFCWSNLQPETVLTILLPPLIFESSFKINSHTFFAKLPFITALTVSVYILSLAMSTALLLPVLYTTHRCAITSVVLLVSILVATDPVAVVAMLEQYGAPHRLRILIEGESLLNDGLALTAYRILAEFLKYESISDFDVDYVGMVLGLFMCIIATPAIGFLLAWFVSWAVSQLDSEKKRQALIVFAVYGTFVFCEAIHGSSALGLVFFGVTLNYYKETMSPETSELCLKLWQTLGYYANNVIFIFAGYIVGKEMFTDPKIVSMSTYNTISSIDLFILLEGLLIYPVPLFSRIMAIVFFYYVNQAFSVRKSRQPPKSDFVILSYAGLRGALGLLLAMELTKMDKLKDNKDSNMIMLLTCSMTCACLVFQGMTFSAVAQKEGTTKRSRYIKDTCLRLSHFLERKMDDKAKDLQEVSNWYLNGANWNVVSETLKNLIKHSSKHMPETVTGDEMDEEDLWEGREVPNEERLRKKNESDAKIGLYGILLAKVHDAWARGAVSGSTSHIIVSLLEHGIDEGTITVTDIKEHLERVECGPVRRCFTNVMNNIHDFLQDNSWLDFMGGMAGRPLFADKNKPDTLMGRSFEKYWVAQTCMMIVYMSVLAKVVFANLDHKNKTDMIWHSVIFLLYGLVMLMTALETVYLLHLENKRWKEDPENQALPKRYCSNRIGSREFIFTILNCLLILAAYMLTLTFEFQGARGCFKSGTSESALCKNIKYVIFSLTATSVFYRILRLLPVLVVILREDCLLRQELMDRVRLAFLMYLLHLMKDTKIQRELFSEAAYKIVSRERRIFQRLIDAVIRNELREHSNELELVSVIKTRQAVRMMSHELYEELKRLKTEGFMPEDAVEKWDEVVSELRISADAILTAPETCIEDWLEKISWIRKMGPKNSLLLKNLLVSKLSLAEHHEVQPGTQIILDGERMAYIKKGICKITGAIDGSQYLHEFYAHQGELLGGRNLLLMGRKGKVLPVTCPKRRYEATTYCELLYLDKATLQKMLELPGNLYLEQSRYMQIDRIIAELRHVRPYTTLDHSNFMDEIKSHGFVSGGPTLLAIPAHKVAIVGAWTELQAIKPVESMDSNYHIRGPAHIYVAPAHDRSEAMVFMYSNRPEKGSTVANVKKSATAAEEKSNISLVQDVNHKVRVRKNIKMKDSKRN